MAGFCFCHQIKQFQMSFYLRSVCFAQTNVELYPTNSLKFTNIERYPTNSSQVLSIITNV